MKKALTMAIASLVAGGMLLPAVPAEAQRHRDDRPRAERDDGPRAPRPPRPGPGGPGGPGGRPDPRAFDGRWRGDNDRRWDAAQSYRAGDYRERRLGRDDRIFRGRDGRYFCRRNDGTTGLVIGGVAGGVLGNVIGGETLGTLIGAAGGAVLGRSVDRGNVRCR